MRSPRAATALIIVETTIDSGTDPLDALLARQRELLARRAKGDDSSRRELQLIESALGRLALGIGGACEICDREIERERLEAHPEATLCRDCGVS